jgi:hypothetical protein
MLELLYRICPLAGGTEYGGIDPFTKRILRQIVVIQHSLNLVWHIIHGNNLNRDVCWSLNRLG